ncbi:MAG: hypothetical protein U0031_19450 [Thermomicrobiales bacterium]
MKRISRYSAIVAVALLGFGTAGGATHAQDATPVATSSATTQDVTFQPIGFAEGIDVPNPADLIVVRITVAPGAVSPFTADDPTSGLLVVESGTFTVNAEAAWSISRGQALQDAVTSGTDGSGITESVAVGQEATLGPGDVAYIPGSVAGQLRNDGQEPAVGLAFLIAPGGMISGSSMPEATPTS